jgi:endonuclease-8
MTGAWAVYPQGRGWRRSPRRAWLVMRSQGHDVVEFDGPTLELMTEGRTRFDQRLAALGPDVLAEQFDAPRFLRIIRTDDQTRRTGDALLDQRNVAGIGNMWKAEACWEAQVDPWRRLSEVSDAELVAIIEKVRPRMDLSARRGPMAIEARALAPAAASGSCRAARGTPTARHTGARDARSEHSDAQPPRRPPATRWPQGGGHDRAW